MIQCTLKKAELNWGFPSIGGGPAHRITATVTGSVQGQANRIECIFELSIKTYVYGTLEALGQVERYAEIGFAGRDKSGRILWFTPKRSYLPGKHREMFEFFEDQLRGTVTVDAILSMAQPHLTQNQF